MPKKSTEKSVFSYKPIELLDEINSALLRELEADPRLPMAELARRVGVSTPTATDRVRRLKEAGVIQGYVMRLDPASLGLPILAFIRVRPSNGQLHRVIELAQKIPEVLECHRVTGEDCFVLKVCFPTLSQLDTLLDQFLLYGSTTTSIIQSSPVLPRNPPLP